MSAHEQLLADLRRRLAEARSNGRPITPVTEPVVGTLCGDRCIRAAGHTGPHLPPLDATLPMPPMQETETSEPEESQG